MEKSVAKSKHSSRLSAIEAFETRHKEKMALQERELEIKENNWRFRSRNLSLGRKSDRKGGKWKKQNENSGWKLKWKSEKPF